MTRALVAPLAFVTSLLVTGCAGAPSHSADAPTADQTRGKAPLPYTAAQIRAAHPDGTVLRFRLIQRSTELQQSMRFENGDQTGVDVVTWSETPEGNRISGPAMQRARWSELRDHATFAAEQTTRSRARCEVGAGSFDCALYVIKGADDAGPVQRYYFADSKPGPPVLLVTEANGQEVLRMELLEYRRGS